MLSCRHEVKVAGECCNRCAANRQEERQAMRRQAHTKEGRRKKQRREKLRRIRNHMRDKFGTKIIPRGCSNPSWECSWHHPFGTNY